VAAASSLDYNLNVLPGGDGYICHSPATDADYTPNPAIPGWQYNVAYEVQLAGGVFGEGILGPDGLTNDWEVTFVNAHASPNKGAEFEHVTLGVLVPEPSMVALLAIGGLVAIMRRRRRLR